MSSPSRTNQLLYQVELVIDLAAGSDEHAAARQMAIEESALALFELALNALLKEVCEHARLDDCSWRSLLTGDDPAIAELQRLRDLMRQPDSWLYWLVGQLERLHSDEGAARRRVDNPAMIALSSHTSYAEQLAAHLATAKRDVAALRESSQEW